MKRKAAAIEVSDDEEPYPVAGHSNATAQSLPELLLSLKMTRDRKVAIPASVWRRVQQDGSITVHQYHRDSPGGYRKVAKTTTHLPNSGVKRKGQGAQLDPITSFMVKDFNKGILVISGYSASTAKNSRDISGPNVSLHTLFVGRLPTFTNHFRHLKNFEL